jgi:hypothetical protein
MFILYFLLFIFSITIPFDEFFTAENQTTPAFKQLLKEHLDCESSNLSDIVTATQAGWMRSDDIERWELSNIEADQDTVELFRELGLVDAVDPLNTEFDYAIIFGATVQAMRKRLAYLLELYNKGVRFKQIVFLVGDRKRDPVKESDEVLQNKENQYLTNKDNVECYAQTPPSNETEMAQMIWNQAMLFELSKIPVIFVHAQSTIINGIVRRPTTIDTVQTWKKEHNPKQGSRILAISSQPHIRRQGFILQSQLPGCFVETAGPGTNQRNLPLFFDEIARHLYSIYVVLHCSLIQ